MLGSTDPLVKPTQDTALPASLQSTTTVTRHTAATTPKPTPTKKVLAPDLQLSTLPALPGASSDSTTTKSVTANKPSKSPQPEVVPPSQAAAGLTSASIAPEPDEVVVVSTMITITITITITMTITITITKNNNDDDAKEKRIGL